MSHPASTVWEHASRAPAGLREPDREPDQDAEAAPVATFLAMTNNHTDALYDELLREHAAGLGRVAASYEWDRALAEDLTQEVLFAVWKALPSFRGESSLRTFAYRVAHNRCLSHRLRKRAPTTDLDAARELADPKPDPEARAGSEQRRVQLQRAIARLPLHLRQTLTLRLEGLTAKEIAEVLGITENNVAVRLHRARDAVRQSLNPDPAAERREEKPR